MTRILLTALLAALPLWGQAPPDPHKPGPFPVGVTTTVFVDTSRTDFVTKKPRTLVTEIWYPATDDSRALPKNRYRDFFPGGLTPAVGQLLSKAYRKPLDEIEKNFWNDAVRDARVRPGKYPLIVFSHGNGGSRTQNTFWFDHLASHGYIIVSADHTGNAGLTLLDGEIVVYHANERAHSAADRTKDVSFLLDEMLRWNRGADSRFAGHIDPEQVAISGMSFGSYTAITAADAEPRFKAVVAMAFSPATHTNTTVPALVMLGAQDKTIGEAGNKNIRKYYEEHTGPTYLIEMKNGGHYSFTDMFKVNQAWGDGVGPDFTPMQLTYDIVNSYSTAFLGAYLKGEKQYLPFLQDNHWQDTIVWKNK